MIAGAGGPPGSPAKPVPPFHAERAEGGAPDTVMVYHQNTGMTHHENSG